MFDAVIFDWDGTLADSKRFIVESFQRILHEVGASVSDEFIGRLMGIGPRDIFKEILKATNIPFDEKMIDELVKKKIETQLRLTENVRLFEGAVDLLDSFQKKVKLALATMSPRRVVYKILDREQLRKYFDVIVTVECVSKTKPDPEIYLECARKLNCKPEKCVVVEDSIFGVKAAKEALMKCIAVPTGAYTKEELGAQNPDLIVDSLSQREKILKFVLS